MPSLDNLPTEIVYLIAHHLGGEYLRAKVDRLLVCKPWYEVARTVAYQDLALTVGRLQCFLAAPNHVHELIGTSTRNLAIESRSIEYYVQPMQEKTNKIETEEDQQSSGPLTPREQRVVHMCQSLISITAHLSRMQVLGSFQLKVLMELPTSKPVENFWNKSISNLVSSLPKTLTSLTIDNRVMPLRFAPDADEAHHICPLLLANNILPSLRYLHIRTCRICPGIFELNNSEPNSRLETLIINLSMSDSEMCGVHHALYCGAFLPRRNNLYLHMLDAAKAATAHFPFMRTFKILSLVLPSFKLAAYDVISDQKDMLQENVHWDDVDWTDDGATDLELTEQSDIDLFGDSFSDTDSLPAEGP